MGCSRACAAPQRPVLVEDRNLPTQTRRTYRTYFYIGGPALAAV